MSGSDAGGFGSTAGGGDNTAGAGTACNCVGGALAGKTLAATAGGGLVAGVLGGGFVGALGGMLMGGGFLVGMGGICGAAWTPGPVAGRGAVGRGWRAVGGGGCNPGLRPPVAASNGPDK